MIALNLALLACVAGIALKGKENWDASRAKRNATLHVAVKPAAVPPIVAVPKPEAASAIKYGDVAQKNLFSKDRNPQVVIEAPPPPEKPKPMPKLPVVYGVMGLPSGVKAVMAEQSGSGTSVVKVGDTVGEFKVMALNTKQVTFDWNGKAVTKGIDELLDRSGPPTPGQPGVAVSAPQPTPAAPQSKPDPLKGVEIGDGVGPSVKACKAGDSSPPGSIVDGYKKVVEATPFGPACRWIKQ